MPSKRALEDEEKSMSPTETVDKTSSTDADPAVSFKGRLSKFRYVADDEIQRRVSKRIRTSTTGIPAETDAIESFHSTSPPRRPKQKKQKRQPSRYADPSKYAHLSPLVDILTPGLICVFVGTNPGVQTATQGHAYAHPSNHFWKLLHTSGLTDRRLRPEEDRSLPALYCMGNTNIVDRPSKDAAELSKEEMAAGTVALDAKFRQYKPEAVCIVGKGIWEAIWRHRRGKNPSKAEFRYGWQDEEHNMGKSADGEEEVGPNGEIWRGSRVFVTTSTSGLAASLKPAEKEAIWKPFGEWVQKRREERGFVPGAAVSEETAQIS